MEAVQHFLQKLQELGQANRPGAYSLLFALLVSAGIGAPVNEDLLLIGAAALTLYSVFDVTWLIPISIIGVVVGDLLIFHWGYRYGARLTRTRLFSKVVSEARLIEFQSRMRARGKSSRGLLFCTRFLPGIRTPIFFAAGSLKIPYGQLLVFDLLAACIQIPALVYGVRFVGGRTEIVLGYLHQFQYVVLALVAAATAYFLVRRKKRASSSPTSSVGESKSSL